MRKIIFAVALLTTCCSGQALLREGCSLDEPSLTTIAPGDNVVVNRALAGAEETCYSVTVSRGDQTLSGYVLGDSLPAVAAFLDQQAKFREEFEKARIELERRLAKEKAEQAAAAARALAAKAQSSEQRDPSLPSTFEDFGGRDMMGKQVSLSGLGGRATLVVFWSPRSGAAKGQLTSTMSLYNRYKNSGLRAVGISTDPNMDHMRDGLDDLTLNWPQLPDRSGLAKRYGADGSKGTAMLLDASHHIVASGRVGDLEKQLRELLP